MPHEQVTLVVDPIVTVRNADGHVVFRSVEANDDSVPLTSGDVEFFRSVEDEVKPSGDEQFFRSVEEESSK